MKPRNPSFPTALRLGLCLLLAGACSDGAPTTEEDPAPHEDEASHTPSGEEHIEGVVELNPEKLAAAGIETSIVLITSLPAQLATTGQVDFDQDRLAHVSPRITGRIESVRARLGQRVRRGEVLAVLDSIELGRAKAEFLQAKAREELTRENLKREEALYADRISSEREMLTARAEQIEAQAVLRNAEETLHLYGLSDQEVASVTYENPGRSLFPVRAPFSGKVVEKHVTIGELVTPDRNLFSLADLSKVWVWIDVYERDLHQVHIDDDVSVFVDAFPDLEFRGQVSYLSDRVDMDTRRVRARIDVENPEERLRPGMFARVELSDPHRTEDDGEGAATIAVPADALQREGNSTIVFVALGGGRYQRREVQSGRTSSGLVEILRGLEAGEKVVSAGAFFLKSELSKDELGEGHGH